MTKREREKMKCEVEKMLDQHGEDGACKLIEVWIMQHKYPIKIMLSCLVNSAFNRRAGKKK